MPNWVYNNLTIAPNDEAGGTIKDVADLVEQVGRAYTIKSRDWKTGEMFDHAVNDPEFSFWNITRPDESEIKEYEESHGASGASPFWYDWNCENWGTKWDASDVEFIDHEPDHKQYRFSTPWAPPIPVLVSLSAQHPNLHIELEWEEEQGFGGTFVFTNGEAHETNYYDVPNSHADFVDRGKEDECACTWGEDDYAFPDCPTAKDNDAITISPDELEIEAMI